LKDWITIMRSDLLEPTSQLRRKNARQERRRIARERLEPMAIDAAFSDDAMPMLAEPTLRRDAAEDLLADGNHRVLGESMLLESLRVQLYALEEQHAQIRRLLDEAGHWRLDPAVR